MREHAAVEGQPGGHRTNVPFRIQLGGKMEGMRATGIREVVREGDFFSCPLQQEYVHVHVYVSLASSKHGDEQHLLQQQPPGRVEEKHGECTVQHARIDARHEMRCASAA